MPCRWLHLARFRGRYGRGENMQGFLVKKFSTARLDGLKNFSPKPAGREAALQILGPVRSFAP